jgi:hypothetical protein
VIQARHVDASLVKGEGFAVDASVMEADASRYHGKAPDEIDWSAPERQTRAVAEFLAGLNVCLLGECVAKLEAEHQERNNKIRLRQILNRNCAHAFVFESMLRS